MGVISTILKASRAKVLILALSIAAIGTSIFSLDYITNRLLEREAFMVGMRWAEDIEASLDNLDKIFTGKPEQSNAPEVLHRLSAIGRIYRYEFINLEGELVFDTSSNMLNTHHTTPEHNAPKKMRATGHTLAGHNHSRGETTTSAMSPSSDHHQHIATLKHGDGKIHPPYYAYIVHPIEQNGTRLGTLKLYIDQTETQALLRQIIFVLFIALSCITIIGFGLPAALYLRGKTREKNQQTHFDATLSIMHQGICIFDDNDKVITANDCFTEIYGLSPEHAKPGTSLFQIVEARIKTGCFIGHDENEYRAKINKLKSNHTSIPTVHELNDGRYVEIYNLTIANGGWLTIHEDITEQTKAKRELALQNKQFDVAISNISQGLCLFDRNRKLIVSNNQYATLFDLSPDMIRPGMHIEEIMQQRIERGSFFKGEATGITPWVDEWSSYTNDTTKIYELENGRFIQILSHPMQEAGWLATMEDVTDRINTENEIRSKNDRMDAALETMPQGLCMFGPDRNLVVSNDQYAEIYKISPELIKPGISLDEIINFRVENGTFVGSSPDDYRKDRNNWTNKKCDGVTIHQLNDGRYVEIRDHAMPDGGWLSTHDDVTKRQNFETTLNDQNQRLDAAISAMPHGLSMFDENENIVISNDQYATIYGLTSNQIKPGMNLKEILKLRVKIGCYQDNISTKIGIRIKKLKKDQITEPCTYDLTDGRHIEVRDHMMANGGWLSIHEDVTERHTTEKKIRRLADYDTLTGLPNRSQIHGILSNAAQQAIEDNQKMALLYIDLDGFKEINDTLGHPVGDHLLNEVGLRLTALSGNTAVAGRLSGDEFVMIVKKYDDISDLEQLGARICKSLRTPIQVENNVIEVAASIGISMGPPESGDVSELVKFSDLALYQSKADGGNCYRFFEEKMFAESERRQRIATDLRNAIRKDELVLHYQPQINLRDGKIVGYEALVRWQHSERGLISPLDFIELAEETGQISEIGEWVLRTACEYAVTWPNKENVAVNLSPVQFKRQDVVSMVKRVLWDTGLAPERLELEITESVLIQSTDSVIITLRTLAEMGISIALDDFGTGFSSLSYLTTFPFNKIKIDKCFIDNLGLDEEVTSIVAMIIGLGHNLNTIITAEGIEETRQHDLLRASGCGQGQGYLYGKPLPEILIVDELKAIKQA